MARRAAGDAMGMDQAMIVAGIGCKRGAAAREIEAAIRAVLERAGIAPQALDSVATIATKRDEAGIGAAAAKLGAAVVLVSEAELRSAGERAQTRSARVQALKGVPSVAEAAALAAAGPSARLIVPRLVVGAAACALAASDAASGAAP
jgi:cobalt-precorrin 5A hydrolase